MRKAIREGLKFLGKDYRLYYIDLSDCIYRDLGDFDIEVEYISNRKLSPHKGYKVYVWRKEPLKIIKRYQATESLEGLKEILDEVVEEYARK